MILDLPHRPYRHIDQSLLSLDGIMMGGTMGVEPIN
jgi:hypothetical protein